MTSLEARTKTNHYIGAILAGLALAAILLVQLARPAEAALLEAQAWGDNYSGQLGNGTAGLNTSTNTPGGVSNLSGVKRLDGGCAHSLALKTNGTLRAWGNNEDGELGAETANLYSATPVKVRTTSGAIFGNIKALAIGCDHNLAVMENGRVFAWGDNDYGKLGDGTKTERHHPVRVKNADGSTFGGVKSVAGGSEHSLALRSDGTVWAWGDNEYGQLGDGTDTAERLAPVKVENLSNVKAIAAGDYFSLALKEDGTVYAWGYNYDGSLGNGTSGPNADRDTPVQVSNLSGVKAIAAGGEHALALKKNGTLRAWGNNFAGQLGDGTDAERTTPVRVKVCAVGVCFPLDDIKAIAAGSSHSLARMEDGTVRAWGYNFSGQLGDGTDVEKRFNPVKVSGLSGMKAIAAGNDHSLAVTR